MQVELEKNELVLLFRALQVVDPTDTFCKALKQKLADAAKKEEEGSK